MMTFTSPKNFKRGRLIANRYRVIDIVIASSCMIFTVVSILTYVTTTMSANPIFLILFSIPSFIAFLMLISFSIYHNFMTYLYLKLINLNRKRNYVWEGIYHYERKD